MKLALAVIVLSGLATLSFLSFASFLCSAGGYGCCIAELINGGSCPMSNILAQVNFHFNAIKFFSLATLDLSILGLVTMAILFLYILARIILSSDLFNHQIQTENRYLAPDIEFENKKLSWLAIHEKRDPLALIF